MKAYIEFDLPESCHDCPLRFIHEDFDGIENIGCGITNIDVTENTENRRHDCPLKTTEYIGYEDSIRIGNETDALRLLEDMIEKCHIEPRPDYNDMEKGFFKVVETVNSYFLPRLESLLDAVKRGIA